MTRQILEVTQEVQPTGAFGEGKAIVSIRLTGNWLEGLGFRIGERVAVEEHYEGVVLRPLGPDSEEINKKKFLTGFHPKEVFR